MAQPTSVIPITYVNATGNTDFEVVVFTKNFSTRTTQIYYAAWQVLRGQTKVQFEYPVIMGVGATYETNGQKIFSGPFSAKLGSSWEITQPEIDGTAVLKEKTGVPKNPDGTIVIANMKPATWSGRMFNVGIYKSKHLLVTSPDLHIGSQVDFTLQPKLFFGVVSNMQVGDVFTSLQITQNLTEFDLSDYPNGIIVTLNEAPGGGEYSFSSAPSM